MEREQPSPFNCRIPIVIMLIVWSLINYPSNVHSQEQPNTVTFINQSGEPALVKLIGPTSLLVEVPNGTSRTVNVAAGEYYELVRYGSQPSHYRYSKGKTFTVEQTATQYSVTSITLHKVVGGNYPTHPISEKEFDDALIAQKTSDKMPPSKALTNQSEPPSQKQLLPWALNRFFALMNETPTKVDEARMRLQQDLEGNQVTIPLVMEPSSNPYELYQSPPESFFAGVNAGNDFGILSPIRRFKVSSGEKVSDINKDVLDKAATLLTGKAHVIWPGKDVKSNNSAYQIMLTQKSSDTNAKILAQIYITDATSREVSQKDISIDAVDNSAITGHGKDEDDFSLPAMGIAATELFKPDTNVGSDIKEKWHAVTFSDDGKELKKEPLEFTLVVSDEVKKKWKGVWLSVGDKKTGIKNKYRIDIGEEMKIPDSDLEIRVLAFIPHLLIQHENHTITAASNQPNNPAVKISIREHGEEVFRSWLFQKVPSYSAFVHERFEIFLLDAIE